MLKEGSQVCVPGAATDPRQTVVVVGNGMVSWRLCHELDACGATAELRVVVIGEEPLPAYDRVRLTALLAGAEVEELLLASAGWYAEAGIDLRLGERVVAIDREDCVVRTARGREIAYDRLVLATGSIPVVPRIAGIELAFVYRTTEDLRAIQEAAQSGQRAVVIGGGLLGLEVAKAVRALGLDLTVVEAGSRLMPRQLDEAGAAVLAQQVARLGVAALVGARIVRIARTSVELADGRILPADLVVVAAGVRPATDLARQAGLELAENGGIVVDDRLQTSDDRIFAVGECAAHDGRVYGLVQPGYEMVEVLVANLAGIERTFVAKAPSTKHQAPRRARRVGGRDRGRRLRLPKRRRLPEDPPSRRPHRRRRLGRGVARVRPRRPVRAAAAARLAVGAASLPRPRRPLWQEPDHVAHGLVDRRGDLHLHAGHALADRSRPPRRRPGRVQGHLRGDDVRLLQAPHRRDLRARGHAELGAAPPQGGHLF